jgi:hypothetical protein
MTGILLKINLNCRSKYFTKAIDIKCHMTYRDFPLWQAIVHSWFTNETVLSNSICISTRHYAIKLLSETTKVFQHFVCVMDLVVFTSTLCFQTVEVNISPTLLTLNVTWHIVIFPRWAVTSNSVFFSTFSEAYSKTTAVTCTK